MNKEWISVNDDLPRVGEAVIFCTKFGTWSGWLELCENDKEDLSWYSCDETNFVENVTHWMHFPEPYYEE